MEINYLSLNCVDYYFEKIFSQISIHKHLKNIHIICGNISTDFKYKNLLILLQMENLESIYIHMQDWYSKSKTIMLPLLSKINSISNSLINFVFIINKTEYKFGHFCKLLGINRHNKEMRNNLQYKCKKSQYSS